MKTKILTGINALIAALFGVLGMSCRQLVAEYGCPYATLDVSGTITDSEAQPVENIQVSVKLNANPQAGKVPVAVSAEDGLYEGELEGVFPVQTAMLYADDTTGVYASDSAEVKLTYDKSQVSPSDRWNSGTATVKQDFQLKKNN